MVLHMNESAQLEFLNECYDFNASGEAIAESIITSNCLYQILGDSDILMEGASDIIDRIVTAIKNLLNAIRKFFVNIIRAISAFSMDYRDYVKNYRKELEEASPNYTFHGFTFDGLFANEPNMDDFSTAINGYNSMISSVNAKEIKKHVITIKEYLEERNVEELRAKVLGTNTPISEDKFSETVRAYYRGCKDDYVSETDIKIDSTYIRKLITDVDNVYRLKEKAESDQKRISSLLAKTEDFFSRKAAILYRGNIKAISAQKVNYNRSEQKVSFADHEVDYSDENDKVITSLINAMYAQVRVIAGVINTCISERAIGFRDYAKQCRKILGEAITNKTDGSLTGETKPAEEGYEMLDGSILEEATNYAMLCEEVRLIQSRYGSVPEIQYQLHEAHRAIVLYETGILPEPVMEGIIGNAIQGMKNFISNLVGMFRKKQVENIQKYSEWYTDNEIMEAVVAQCNDKEYTALPLWEGNWGTNAVAEINKLFSFLNKEPSNPANADFTANITNHETIAALKEDKKRVTKILNHYRAGKPVDYIEPRKIGGAKLASEVKEMFAFMGNYSALSTAAKQFQSKAEQIHNPLEKDEAKMGGGESSVPPDKQTAVMNGYEHYLQLAGVLMEAGTGDAANQPKEAAQQVNVQGNEKHQQAATQIRETSDENNKSDEAKETGEEKKDDGKAALNEYYKQLCTYTQQVVSSYLTTLEERYTLYWKLLTSIAPEEFKPIFKDGVYQGTKKTGLKDKAKDLAEKVTKRQDATRLSGGSTQKNKKKK